MMNFRRLYNRVFTSTYAYYSPKYRPAINEKSPKIALAFHYLIREIGIESTPICFLKPIRQPKDVALYGMTLVKGHVVVDPRFDLSKNIETLSHELWHTKQIIDGDLEYVFGDYGNYEGLRWKGVFYEKTSKLFLDAKSMDRYHELPWEIDAYANESRLFSMSMDYIASIDKKTYQERLTYHR
jgi:uncharacterized protein YutD